MQIAIWAGLTSVFLGLVVAGLILHFMPRTACPYCRKKLPQFRKADNPQQAILGGWTCPHCGGEVDANGGVLRSPEQIKADRLNREQTEDTIQQIQLRLAAQDTKTLMDIYRHPHPMDWTEEALEAIRRELEARGENLPERKRF